MSEEKLKTAILGLNEGGQLLLEAAKGIDYFQIHAVADKDTNLAERFAAGCQCAAYDDYRQLVMEMDSSSDKEDRCLLVAAGIHSCDEYVRLAMKKKFNVLKLAPAARNFEEAAEFVRLGEDENVTFAIANPSRFARSFLKLREFLQQGKIEQIFLMTAFCSVEEHPHLSWQTDPKLAGGGVLLYDCYQTIDQIVLHFGIPQQVYCLNTNQAQDKQQRLYLTEDTTVVTMKFSDTLIGNLIASRRAGIGPREEFLKLYGKEKKMTVKNSRLKVTDSIGQISEELEYEDDQLVWTTEQLKNFALSILLPNNNKLYSSGRENLKNMAVIESAYLSARTGFPEEPRRILQIVPQGPRQAEGFLANP